LFSFPDEKNHFTPPPPPKYLSVGLGFPQTPPPPPPPPIALL